LPTAVSLTEEIMTTHRFQIGEIKLLPTGGGVFEVELNGELIFSKKELGRFPEQGEIPSKLTEKGVKPE
jgi:selenoprotein W-related protein